LGEIIGKDKASNFWLKFELVYADHGFF